MTGYAKLYGKIHDNPLFKDKPAARHLFMDILAMNPWGDRTLNYAGRVVVVGRGQVVISTRALTSLTGFTHRAVRTILANLQSHDIVKIDTLPGNGPMVITICNFDKYHDTRHSADTAIDTAPTQDRHRTEEREEKEERKITTVAVRRAPLFGSQQMELPSDMDPDLEAIRQKWNAYAKEAGKAQVRKLTKDRRDAIRQIIADNGYTFADIDEAIEMANRSNYLTEEGWFSFDWLFKSGSNISKVQEGKYGNGRHAETEEDMARDGLAILRQFGLEEATQ